MSAFVLLDAAGAELAETDDFCDALQWMRSRPKADRVLRRSDGVLLTRRFLPREAYLASLPPGVA